MVNRHQVLLLLTSHGLCAPLRRPFMMSAISASLDKQSSILHFSEYYDECHIYILRQQSCILQIHSEYYDECHLHTSFKNFRPLDKKVVYCIVNIMLDAIENITELNFSVRCVYHPKRSKHAKIINMGWVLTINLNRVPIWLGLGKQTTTTLVPFTLSWSLSWDYALSCPKCMSCFF